MSTGRHGIAKIERIEDYSQFDEIIDVRTPAEFAEDHIPGSINCPVLDDAQRAIIGTLYKQQGAFAAKRLGAAWVAANLARNLTTTLADRPANWKPLVYCWRGGMHSGSMVTWLRMVGWDAQQLTGGYKAYRHHVVEQLRQRVPQLRLRVVCGATGSAKTRLLHALQAQGAQVVVHALNPAYTHKAWREEAPALMEAAIAVTRQLRATLMLPGNVYNFGEAMPPVLREDTPQAATGFMGRMRVQLEQRLQALPGLSPR